ncbi:hypothetical protein TNCV_188001 [Trichonephila clavipes]|nr:hypothetical protein TNCV_188001 [Trichonephila clavipes]
MPVLFRKETMASWAKNRPENVNHVTACLQRFVEDEKEESEKEETVEEEEEACGCRDFQPVPRDMQGRRKDRLSEYVGFYDSLFEKPEMWEEGIEFQGGLGKRCVGYGPALSEGRLDVVSHYGKTGHV